MAAQTFRRKPSKVEAIQWTGSNITEIWEAFGANGIYGPTEQNPTALLLTTVDDVQVPCPVGHWVVAEPVHGRFYPCDPQVFAGRYELDPATPRATVAQHRDFAVMYIGDRELFVDRSLERGWILICRDCLPIRRHKIIRVFTTKTERARWREQHEATSGHRDMWTAMHGMPLDATEEQARANFQRIWTWYLEATAAEGNPP